MELFSRKMKNSMCPGSGLLCLLKIELERPSMITVLWSMIGPIPSFQAFISFYLRAPWQTDWYKEREMTIVWKRLNACVGEWVLVLLCTWKLILCVNIFWKKTERWNGEKLFGQVTVAAATATATAATVAVTELSDYKKRLKLSEAYFLYSSKNRLLL